MAKWLSKTEVYEYGTEQEANKDINALTGKWEIRKYQPIGQDVWRVEYRQIFVDLSNKEAIANEIQLLESLITSRDTMDFTDVIDSYLYDVDPNKKMTTKEAVMKLELISVQNLYEFIKGFKYKPIIIKERQ